ncbi:CHAD domain-containing protein [Mycolicibacterium duvalii]|uniref:CHAD domain-containing protein n=1 Tax=Mycolicibacterium duvalii TaxID=39688 RepID=A0A7I7JVU4_9MYCO|nr:CYTH and CHAD domain-containing protein [Mycolicibacterium duvalii]MCV7369923.1 CYTH and CHAD domain-containing protein [Mycolicibacterium duvalii]PEG38350.1 CHAD domain-containing protein [Mycolicibacterium duvalii]BBX15977.1 CHAD domain-containing protein [Mycolicibacterium duvalii]
MAADSTKTSRYTETERKFEVVDTTVAPSFAGLSAVARAERSLSQSLDAVYFDTPGGDLRRHRITLRRRTGGTDAGWHVKLPAGPDTRTEVRAPLDDDADPTADGDDTAVVPEAIRDVVLAIVRDQSLAPVARIRTVRTVETLYGTDGVQIAEFCDDRVSASADGGDEMRWREWELELAPGADPELFDRLTNRLLDAGAQPAGHGSKLARVLSTDAADSESTVSGDPLHRAVAAHVEELLEWDRAVRADVDDSVHQMRVTVRKIRSLLQSAEDTFGITDDHWVLEELRELGAVLGIARDAEVLAERYERALDALPADEVRGPVRARLVEGARKRYQTGWKRSLSAMRSPRYFRLLDALEALTGAEPPAERKAEKTADRIESAYRRVRKAVKAARTAAGEAGAESPDADGPNADEALHRIRKRAKRLRYTAAASAKTKVADRAKAVQSLLGDHQDSVVSRAHLSRQAESAHAAGEDTFTYGVLYQQEADLAQRCEEQLDAALKDLDKAVAKATKGG